MNSFQHAVAGAPQDPTWRDDFGERLIGLYRAFAEHVGLTEGPDGLYHELIDHAPRLAPGVHGLVRDHQHLLAAMEGLRAQVAAGPDMDELRDWAGKLLDELYRHRQRGADLVYEAYDTDLGGET
jgi:hypothetical protein